MATAVFSAVACEECRSSGRDPAGASELQAAPITASDVMTPHRHGAHRTIMVYRSTWSRENKQQASLTDRPWFHRRKSDAGDASVRNPMSELTGSSPVLDLADKAVTGVNSAEAVSEIGLHLGILRVRVKEAVFRDHIQGHRDRARHLRVAGCIRVEVSVGLAVQIGVRSGYRSPYADGATREAPGGSASRLATTGG